MGRMIRNVALAAALAFTVPAAAQAQFIYGGGGIVTGVGDTGDVTDAGWMILGGIGFPVGDGGIAIGGEGVYGSLSGADTFADVDIWGVFGTVGIAFGDEGNVRPYVYGGAGILGTDVDTGTTGADGSDSSFGYEGVAGLDIPVGGVGVFIEGRYMGSSDVDLIGAVAGLSIGVG